MTNNGITINANMVRNSTGADITEFKPEQFSFKVIITDDSRLLVRAYCETSSTTSASVEYLISTFEFGARWMAHCDVNLTLHDQNSCRSMRKSSPALHQGVALRMRTRRF